MRGCPPSCYCAVGSTRCSLSFLLPAASPPVTSLAVASPPRASEPQNQSHVPPDLLICLSPHARDRWVWREAGLRGDPHDWWEGVQKAGAGTTGQGSRATKTLGEACQAEGRASSKTGRWAAGWDQAEWTGGESWSEARGLAKGESRGPRSSCVSGRCEWKAAHEILRAAQGAYHQRGPRHGTQTLTWRS